MSFVDVVLRLLSGMERIPGLPESDKQLIRDKAAALPGLVGGVAMTWPAYAGKELLSREELHAIYQVLEKSKAGPLYPFDPVMDALLQPVTEGVITPEQLYQWGVELDCLSPRVPGTHSMDQTADYLIEQLQSFGLEAWSEPFNFRGVFFHEWSLTILGDAPWQVTCFPENNVGFGEVEAEVVYIGGGQEADYQGRDVRGKIVLVNWGELWDHEGPCTLRQRYGLLHLYDLAWAHGAAAMVGYFADTVGNALKILEPGIKPTGGSNVWGPAELGPDHQYRLPVLNIGHDDGEKLRQMAEQGATEARLMIRGVRKVSTTPIVVGMLPGLSNRTIAAGAHCCTAFEGAICDTVGVVGALALAKYFAGQPLANRRKSMLFFFDSFHVWGNCCQSALMLLHRHRSLVPNIEAFLWLDHISDGLADTPRMTMASDNALLWPLAALAMARHGIMPVAAPLSRIWSMCAVGPFDREGVPSISMQALGELVLTTEDNWNKFKPPALYRDVALHIELAQALQVLTPPPYVPGEPIGGCGALFQEVAQPEYPAGESYQAEADYPLYVGGEQQPVRILRNAEQKRAFVGGQK